MEKIIIGSRGSDLALWQANEVMRQLKTAGLAAEIKIIKTQGDRIQHLSLDKLEGKGFFTKELEDALLANEIDLAVHSHKDLPTESPPGLIIAAVSEREDPAELLLINKDAVDPVQKFSLKHNAVLGTSSARRKAQILAFREDITIGDLRGNVPTRIHKLKEKQYDAILLACAGVLRLQLDLSAFHVEKLDPREFIPAPAQGVLALQIRESDTALLQALKAIHRAHVAETIAVERKVLNLLEGGCHLPLGAYCVKEKEGFGLWVARAAAWDKFPQYLYLRATDTQGLAERAVNKLEKEGKNKSVFITRDPESNPFFFKALQKNGYEVWGEALIETKKVAFKEVPETDWIFFSSRNAVRYFFEQQPRLTKGVKFAAVGKSTAALLQSYRQVDFYGDSPDTNEVGKKFAEQVKKGSVLFPQSNISMRTVQKQLGKTVEIKELVTYETIQKKSAKIPAASVVVFTSPSNVDAFMQQSRLEGVQVIAMGISTAEKLKQYGAGPCHLPATADEMGLVQAVLSLD